MSFVDTFNALPMRQLLESSNAATQADVDKALGRERLNLEDFATLIGSKAETQLEQLAQASRRVTLRRFGRVIRLFAPLYLSNECINNCQYCGFSRDNPILRVTLDSGAIDAEAEALRSLGFRSVLLVAGEHPKFVSSGYLQNVIERLRPIFPSIALEVGPMETPEYVPLFQAGAESLVVYQETYDRKVYAEMHTAGPKKNFDWRLETPERANEAGCRRIGIGALFGLADWRTEAISLAAHLQYLQRHCWKSQLTVAFPRLRPCAGEFEPRNPISDRHLAQLICATRLMFPDVGIVLSTREPAALRDGLIPIGVTHMSAGSHTEPGGYTGAGREDLHQTRRGRRIELETAPTETQGATGQFDIADERAPSEVASIISKSGYEPVWKDWDEAILAPGL